MLKYTNMRGVRQAAVVKKVSAKIPDTVIRKASFALVNSVQSLRLQEATLVGILRQMRQDHEDDTHNLNAIAEDIRKIIGDITKAIPREVLVNEFEFKETDLPRYGDEPAL